jgi:hypothetical protein
MRTTVLVDDDLGQAAKARAQREGITFSAFVAQAIAERVARSIAEPPPARPFRLITYGRGGPLPGVNLDRISELLDAEDIERYRRNSGA